MINRNKKGSGVKYVGRQILTYDGIQHQLNSVIYEIFELLKNPSSNLSIVYIKSASGFIFLLSFFIDKILFRSDQIDENNNPLPTLEKMSLSSGKVIKKLILKFVIVDDQQPYTSKPLVINGKSYNKDNETESSFKNEIISQVQLYNDTFRYSGKSLLPNIIGSAILNNENSLEFLNAYLMNHKEIDKNLVDVFSFIIDELSLSENKKLGIIVMEKLPGVLLTEVLNRGSERLLLESVSLSAAIAIIIFNSTKNVLLDAHSNNWFFNPMTKDISAIDFGRILKITDRNVVKSITKQFFKKGWQTFQQINKSLTQIYFIKAFSSFLNLNLDLQTTEQIKYALKEIINDIADLSDHLLITLRANVPSLLYYTKGKTGQTEWFNELSYKSIHFSLILWSLLDGFSNAILFKFPYCQNRFITNEIWCKQNYGTNILTLLEHMNVSLEIFVQTESFTSTEDNDKNFMKNSYLLISHYINLKTTNPESVSLRIPKTSLPIYDPAIGQYETTIDESKIISRNLEKNTQIIRGGKKTRKNKL